jgi:hypothetical protein
MPTVDTVMHLIYQLSALEMVPGSYIVVSPDLVVLTASNAYLADILKRREDLVGRYLFDAFPDNPAAPCATGAPRSNASSPRASPTRWPCSTTTCPTLSCRGTSWSATGYRAIGSCQLLKAILFFL